MRIFEDLESSVRTYSRSFPTVFARACGSLVFDERGRRYIDFLSGAGSLNYGHNHPALKEAILQYLANDGITHSLDLATTAKRSFIEKFESVILKPRGLSCKFQFTGPTGANGVEAALKLARKVTGRRNVVSFTRAFHGLSSGALAVTANAFYRDEAFIQRSDVSFLPYDGYLGDVDTMSVIRRALTDSASGVDHPAACIVEAVQSEGGIHVASRSWLQALQALCRERGVLLIVDDIQAGNGRTGSYFSFEDAGLDPDMVILSKSIGGYGLPMTLLLLKPELDAWLAGEHTGTFRGNNLAFVAGAEALNYWKDDAFAQRITASGSLVEARLRAMAAAYPEHRWEVRGKGLLRGLDVGNPDFALAVRQAAFENGLIVELCGARETVMKILPPLTTETSVLEEGLAILGAAISRCLSSTV